ncbi:Raptor N-terminal CASPase-like domain [Phytophthora cactorum]|nr:Raptor N-terminal CASPase-like domain [Phytophthora cactorum]
MDIVPWRMRERMKTMDVALVLCLNIGTDPPDVEKSTPCARKECWVDPFSMPAKKAIETIGNTLQSQYERWQPRARYKQSLDPTVEKIRELCVNRRRLAKHDRVLFHYNGHGVPRPTQNGEVWVFNKSYTQYIPLLVRSAAEPLHVAPADSNSTHGRNGSPSANEAIVLAACAADELLPMNPELCADVFTSCLTTPITVALRWFISQNELSMAHLDASFIERIPGKLTDRKTPLGELNWIFTAITDTIAWNMLPRELFQKLFRQDLLVASLFRNFLLAERIMKSEGCSPCSLPALPPTNHHSLWRSWDLAAEVCLNQLYKLSNPYPNVDMSFQPSRFFAEQLTAFEVWLQFGSSEKPPPQQLPMVLQVLLSQVHRLRALVLLKKFLDLGPWAVNLALSVGIFPYVLKLLQSPASELRQVLVFIWAKILALDSSCQVDLVKDDGHSYFISHLAAGLHNGGGNQSAYSAANSMMPAEQKVMAAFIISVICNKYLPGQKSCLPQYLHKICINLLQDPDEDVRKWICLCLAKLWEHFDDAKRIVIEDKVPRILGTKLRDDRPELWNCCGVAGMDLHWFDGRVCLLWPMLSCTTTINHALSLSPNISRISQAVMMLETRWRVSTTDFQSSADVFVDEELLDEIGEGAKYYAQIWHVLKEMQSRDPFPQVVDAVKAIVSFVNANTPMQPAPPVPKGLRSAVSVGNFQQYQNKFQQGSGNLLGAGDGHVAPLPPPTSVGSNMIQGQYLGQTPSPVGGYRVPNNGLSGEGGMGGYPVHVGPPMERYGRHEDFPPTLLSTCYERHKAQFNDPILEPVQEDEDPLSEKGAERWERYRRYNRIRGAAMKLAPGFSSPRSSGTQKTGLGLRDASLHNPSSYSPIEYDAARRMSTLGDQEEVKDFTMNLRQRAVLNNDAEMTSLLLFTRNGDEGVDLREQESAGIYHGLHSPHPSISSPKLLSSFVAVPDLVPGTRGSGLVMNWQQDTGTMYTGGNSSMLRGWDLRQEKCTISLPTQTDSCITSMASDKSLPGMLVAGFGDGTLRVFDSRSRPDYAVKTIMKEHTSWVVQTHIYAGRNELLTGSVTGELKFWDMRYPKNSVKSLEAHRSPMTALAVHDYAPIFASGSHNQFIKVFRSDGEQLALIRYHEGFLGERIGPVSCLAFHPHRLFLAAGATDSVVAVYSSDK